MDKRKTTETASRYNDLEKMSTSEILATINKEDALVAEAVSKTLPAIEKLVDQVVPRMLDGGRVIYIGAGTSGRLGILDASECPPTFGVPPTMVHGLIAGGDGAIRKAVEFAEDDREQGWLDIEQLQPNFQDTVIGIAASGKTPYVIGAVEKARENGLMTGCITCNMETPLSKACMFPIEAVVGPEFVTGSTRMKAGTAQKMILNMISTSIMIKLGRVKGNKMVDMQLTNTKLIARGVAMIVEELKITKEEAEKALLNAGSVRKVLEGYEF
ncbi:MAG: N-acetylmuramic acid 6-phosphate etherase [Bacteroidota bacterium]